MCVLEDKNNIKDLPAFSSSFNGLFRMILSGDSERVMIKYFKDGKENTITEKDFLLKVDLCAAALKKFCSGIPKGSWIVLKNPNHIYWYAVLFGLMKIGYNVLLTDANCTDSMFEFYARQAHLAAVVTSSECTVKGLLRIDFNKVISSKYECKIDENWSDKLALCTSGTTGTAKVFVFKASAIIHQDINVAHFWAACPSIKREIGTAVNNILASLPFHHTYGFGLPIIIWFLGWTLVFPEKPGIIGFIDGIKKADSCLAYSVPVIWEMALNISIGKYGRADAETFKLMFGNQFKVCITSGAHMDFETKKALRNTGLNVVDGYGMTESGFVTLAATDNPKSNYTGVLYNKHTARVLLPDGTIQKEGTGELLLDGMSMYCATLHDGKEIPRITEYGSFFRTGDIFTIDGDDFYFEGRIKNVIVNDSGENIYPEEIEEHFAFLTDEAVRYCVIGVNEDVVLIIQPKEYDCFEKSAVLTKIIESNHSLPISKKVSKVWAFRDDLSRTAKGEIAKFKLADEVSKRKSENSMIEITLKGRRRLS